VTAVLAKLAVYIWRDITDNDAAAETDKLAWFPKNGNGCH
jgi:hypothetical protein